MLQTACLLGHDKHALAALLAGVVLGSDQKAQEVQQTDGDKTDTIVEMESNRKRAVQSTRNDYPCASGWRRCTLLM